MNIATIRDLALDQAQEITGEERFSHHNQQVAFKLVCLSMAKEKAGEA